MQLNLPVIDETIDVVQKSVSIRSSTIDGLSADHKTFRLPEFSELVNFSTRNEHPIHRWFFYREGYSPKPVEKLLKRENISKRHKVLDPFCGGGTTLLVSAQKGIKSTGYEINKFSTFASKVKNMTGGLRDVYNQTCKVLLSKKTKELLRNKWW